MPTVTVPLLVVQVFPTLYKIGGRGQILEWKVSVFDGGKPAFAEIKIEHGHREGTITESKEKVTEGKNIGKANETSPTTQAILQAESRWNKQRDKGYRETVEEAEKAAVSNKKPMLAHKWDDKKHTLEVGMKVVIQPKLDGMRALAHKQDGEVTLTSRSGKPIESVPHINAELVSIMQDGETWDGELYVHGVEFEKLMSICRKSAKKRDPEYQSIEFHVFDVVGPEEFYFRTCPLDGGFGETSCVKAVSILNYEVGEDFEEKILSHLLPNHELKGYEGVIIRRTDLPYEHKRSIQLIKVKTFHDEEFVIIGSEDGHAGSNKEGLLQTFILSTSGGKEFKASLFGTEEKLREMWGSRDTYKGELATVVFQEKTKYGIPRFPKVKAVRGKEDLCSQ